VLRALDWAVASVHSEARPAGGGAASRSTAYAFPDRLDLCDTHARLAKELGVPVVISTDSHATTHLHSMRFGVDQARRGWLERGDVANTLPLERLQARFAPHHRRVTAAPSRRPARRSSPGARPR
jgi:hypothetical protein